MPSPINNRWFCRVIIREVVLWHFILSPFAKSLSYSSFKVNWSYSEWPVTKTCLPPLVFIMYTPASSESEEYQFRPPFQYLPFLPPCAWNEERRSNRQILLKALYLACKYGVGRYRTFSPSKDILYAVMMV